MPLSHKLSSGPIDMYLGFVRITNEYFVLMHGHSEWMAHFNVNDGMNPSSTSIAHRD